MFESGLNKRNKAEEMTLEEKVGQLFTFYYKATDYSEPAEQYIVECKAGGLFLDMECQNTPAQLHELTSRMQHTALERGSGIPLFIAADLVAGAGCKLAGGGAVHFPKNMAVGAADDEELAYASGRITAAESLSMGVNFNYSPVVDINNNPDNPVIGTHSFGATRELVCRMGTAVICGYQDHGMIATAKHFPGHGDTNVDSHLDLPVLPFERERLEHFELEPFRQAIAAGVEAVMVGHIAVPGLDPSMLPASLSKLMVTGVLREAMGFDGLIVTDGMSMKGVTAAYTQVHACVMALQAGVDILLVDETEPGEGKMMYNAVLEAVRSGELDEERITASVTRILRAKAKYGLDRESFTLKPFDPSALHLEAYEKTALELARKALIVHGPAESWKRLAAYATGKGRWRMICDSRLPVFGGRTGSSGFVDEVKMITGYEELPGELREAPGEISLLVAITSNKRMRKEVLKQLASFAAEAGRPVLLVHFGSPFDAECFPELPALLLHDSAPALQKAGAEYIERLLSSEGRG